MPVSEPTPVSRVLQDPRNVITEDAFRLDPALLGVPLARPWRRAVAISIDGMLVAVLASAPSVLFGFAAAFVLFRASAGTSRGSFVRRGTRLMFRLGGAVVLFAMAISVWDRVEDATTSLVDGEDAEGSGIEVEVAPGGSASLSGLAGLSVAADALALSRADDEAEARESAERLVESLRAQEVSADDIRDILEDLSDTPDHPWMAAVADSLLGEVREGEAVERLSGDSLALALASALEAGDSTGAAELRQQLAVTLAADSLARLDSRLRDARRERSGMERERDRALDGARRAEEGGGIMRMLRSIADDLGLGLGWTGLYFTASLALWKGYTPGKRLLRVRVIRLDGKPIGWWAAFERFGGYAASTATGLLGFFQIIWDRNRQGIHDKIAETVVVQE